MAENEERKPVGEPDCDDTKINMMKTLAKKMRSQVKVERFEEPRTVQAVAAVSFKGDTVYCTDKDGSTFAEAAANALAVHIGCVLVHKLSTPEGILELMHAGCEGSAE